MFSGSFLLTEMLFSSLTDGTRRGSCHFLIVHRCLGFFVLGSMAAMYSWVIESLWDFLYATRFCWASSSSLQRLAWREPNNRKIRTERSTGVDSPCLSIFRQLSDNRSLLALCVHHDALDVKGSDLVWKQTTRARTLWMAGCHTESSAGSCDNSFERTFLQARSVDERSRFAHQVFLFLWVTFWLTPPQPAENFREQSKYENHLIGKVALFQFVNSFSSLFYVAFYLGDYHLLKEVMDVWCQFNVQSFKAK